MRNRPLEKIHDFVDQTFSISMCITLCRSKLVRDLFLCFGSALQLSSKCNHGRETIKGYWNCCSVYCRLPLKWFHHHCYIRFRLTKFRTLDGIRISPKLTPCFFSALSTPVANKFAPAFAPSFYEQFSTDSRWTD